MAKVTLTSTLEEGEKTKVEELKDDGDANSGDVDMGAKLGDESDYGDELLKK